ncbi:MAG TPA: DUF5916 domain-containing protein [Longimicrobiales bacterium]|nr:DUF5916 domain-containing protein [Longimicrobiales bacterium]
MRRLPAPPSFVAAAAATLCAGAPAGAAAQEGPARKSFEAPRLEAAATIDGSLDEPVWAEAALLEGFHQYEPIDGRPAEERTEVLVWYAPDAIFFGIRAFDSRPSSIRATNADRDAIDSDDHVLIYLDTFNDQRRAYLFGVNPLGVQQDGVRTEGASSAGNIFGGSVDTNPDFIFESAGRLTDDGYVIEVRIPFKSLRFPSSGEQTWGINVLRQVQRTGYRDTWTDVRRANASFLLQAGSMSGLRDLERGVVYEVQPFVTASVPGRRLEGGSFERDDLDPDAGLNARLGFTNATLDATVNPDFSQVETDVGQVTVNERFDIFFPEKRPFFLEGIELFSTPNQLIYTRRILNPLGGAKLTGKLGRLGVAYLSAYDEVSDGTEALFNIARLRADFGENSLVGLTVTDRNVMDSPEYSRVLAGDVRYVFGRMYYFEAQAGASFAPTMIADSTVGAGFRAGDSEGSPLWKLELDRTGRSWGFNYQLNGIGEDFEAASGFVPRNDNVNGHFFNRLTYYGARGAAIETVQVFFGPSRLWLYDDFGSEPALEGSETVNATVRFRGGWQVTVNPQRAFLSFLPGAYDGFATFSIEGDPIPYEPLAKVQGYSVTLSASTPTFQQGDGSVSYGYGRTAIFAEGSQGTGTTYSAAANLRPTGSLRVELRTTVQRIERVRDGSEFSRTVIPRVKVEYQPTRALFFRTVAEYRSERRDALRAARSGAVLFVQGDPVPERETNGLRLDLLASYRPTPGTVAFLGYGTSMDTREGFGFDGLERRDDGFFLKLAYQLRR